MARGPGARLHEVWRSVAGDAAPRSLASVVEAQRRLASSKVGGIDVHGTGREAAGETPGE